MRRRDSREAHVIIVGGGFAGLGCARELAKHDNVHVTFIDMNPYDSFLPLLYQVATCMLSTDDVAYPLQKLFQKHPNVEVKLAEVTSVDPAAKTVSTKQGDTYRGDYVVIA